MEFEFLGNSYSSPATLSDIPLAVHVAWVMGWGKTLKEKEMEIATMEPGDERDLEESILIMDRAITYIAHYCGIQDSDIREYMDISQLLNIHGVSAMLLAAEETTIVPQPSYEWGKTTWFVRSPVNSVSGPITHAEFITTIELGRLLLQLAKGDWYGVPKLCAAYLRQEGEEFTVDLIAEDSNRLKLMDKLPLDIAMGVLGYLRDSLEDFTAIINQHVNEENAEPE